jgi:hypothetical protein
LNSEQNAQADNLLQGKLMNQLPMSANGPAYETVENRHGVPLDYVAEKLGCAILELHSVGFSNPDMKVELHGAMYYQLVAFLALNNMLAAANDQTLTDRIFNFNRTEAERWINLVHRQGDVSGIDQSTK